MIVAIQDKFRLVYANKITEDLIKTWTSDTFCFMIRSLQDAKDKIKRMKRNPTRSQNIKQITVNPVESLETQDDKNNNDSAQMDKEQRLVQLFGSDSDMPKDEKIPKAVSERKNDTKSDSSSSSSDSSSSSSSDSSSSSSSDSSSSDSDSD